MGGSFSNNHFKKMNYSIGLKENGPSVDMHTSQTAA